MGGDRGEKGNGSWWLNASTTMTGSEKHFTCLPQWWLAMRGIGRSLKVLLTSLK